MPERIFSLREVVRLLRLTPSNSVTTRRALSDATVARGAYLFS